jgi:hypothetical protein
MGFWSPYLPYAYFFSPFSLWISLYCIACPLVLRPRSLVLVLCCPFLLVETIQISFPDPLRKNWMQLLFRNLCLYIVKKNWRFLIIPGQGEFAKWHLGWEMENEKKNLFYSVLSHALEEDGLPIQIKKTFYTYTVVILLYYFYGPGDTEKTVLAGCTPPGLVLAGGQWRPVRQILGCPPPSPPQLDSGSCLVRRPLCYEDFLE